MDLKRLSKWTAMYSLLSSFCINSCVNAVKSSIERVWKVYTVEWCSQRKLLRLNDLQRLTKSTAFNSLLNWFALTL